MPQRFSQQRERIYQTVLESRAHPTAEMVYQQLKPEMPRLSLGTVYRNLQQMAREGRLTELDGPVTRFDAVTRPHTHFRCRACGAVLDLETVPYDERLDRLAAAQGCVVTGHTLIFTGHCPRCAGQDGRHEYRPKPICGSRSPGSPRPGTSTTILPARPRKRATSRSRPSSRKPL